jgi:radical SAM superfamily enzyme YgiQ (UPF0313 family)
MKITFIDPPKEDKQPSVERVFGCTYTLYPIPNIFNLYVAALLKQKGIEVAYKDAAAENLSRKRFLRFIQEDNSDIYYIHSVNLALSSDIRLSRDLLRLNKGARIIFAGPGPTYFTQDYIYNQRIYVVRGEAEVTTLELINRLKENKDDLRQVLGISFMRQGKIIHNRLRPLLEDLDSLPFPAREIVERGLYYSPKLPAGNFTVLLASRNCSYRCIFCVPNSQSFATELEYRGFNGQKPPVRLRSARSVISEMQQIKTAGYKFVSIVDDQFLWDEQRSLKICAGLEDLGVSWGCLSRCDRISEKLTRAMRRAGCSYVDFGVESFSQKVLDYIKKGFKVNDIYNSIAILKRHGIKVKLNMLLGTNPFETEEDLWHNINECIRIRPDAVMFSIACPFPGTQFYELARKNNWLRHGRYSPVSVQHSSILDLPNLGHERLAGIIKKANIKFYLRPNFMMQNMTRLSHPKNLLFTLRAFYRKIAIKQ